MMDILVLGGTGAIGIPLVELASKDFNVYVTSRKEHKSYGNVQYIQGDAKNKDFLEYVLTMKRWTAVIDFMIHTADILQSLIPLFLDNTHQYIFISSARVYAQSDELITENTPRLLDACNDNEYLQTNEYALAKAREEDLLFNSERTNFTIIRPSITYNANRLQLGVLEKENWLYRALNNRSIVFSEDLIDKLTTMTHGNDVAKGIYSIIGKKDALGQAFHITYSSSYPWREILNIYQKVLSDHLGKEVPIILTKKSTNLNFKEKIYQLIYCRYFNRTFDNSKIARFCDINSFIPTEKGLSESLRSFLVKPIFNRIPWKIEAVNDRISGEYTPLSEIDTFEDKVTYLFFRYNVGLLFPLFDLIIRVYRKIIK